MLDGELTKLLHPPISLHFWWPVIGVGGDVLGREGGCSEVVAFTFCCSTEFIDVAKEFDGDLLGLEIDDGGDR